uniref:CS domain-containing protein n=2 Tax=Lygus hesperus TaxID=30085 RepID=A0A0A9ZCE5_LYGHE
MPLIVNDYTWSQTDSLVIVKVPLHKKLPRDVDLFTSSKYIKAHFPPYLFEAALSEEIVEENSKCVLRDGHILFLLAKRENMTWASLTKELTKQELIRLKEEAIAETHNKFEKMSNEKAIQKSQRQSACVSKHLALEGEAKAEIQRKKETLKTNALTDFMEWKKTETDDSSTLLPLWKKLQAKPSEMQSDEEHPKDDHLIFDDESIKTKKETQNINKKLKPPPKTEKPLPPNAPIRVFVNIKCDFTHRSFPTPMRESKFTEEEEWLSKQAEARRKTGFMVEDLRPEENNPEWLLDKGKSFHDVGNYLGAVSAFSHAIRTWNKIPELYAARAATQVKLGNWRRAIFDATECLELCRPHVEANADLRFACHLHRGLGLLEVGKGKSALADFIEALELRPDDGRLEHLMDRAESLQAEQEVAEAQETMRRLITTEDDGAAKLDTKYLSPADLAN